MKAVTVQQNEAHVTSWQDRMLNQAAFGEDSYVLNIGQKMVAETYSNNEIRIRDGALVHQGCLSVIQKGTYDAVTIQNGTQGMKRVDLIVARYTKNAETQIENVNWVVIQGTPAASNPSVPSYIEGDIQNGDLTVDMPMYQVHLNGINIENVTAVYTSVQTMLDMQADISSLNSNLLKYESIMLPNINKTDYMIWNDIPARYGKIVNIWNDDRTISLVAVTGFSYFSFGSRNLVIHFDSALLGNIRLGLLYMPGI